MRALSLCCSRGALSPAAVHPRGPRPLLPAPQRAHITQPIRYHRSQIPEIPGSAHACVMAPCWKSLTSKPPAENPCHGLVRNISHNKSQTWCCTGQGTWYLVQPLCCRADEPQGRGRAKGTEMRPYAFESLTQSWNEAVCFPNIRTLFLLHPHSLGNWFAIWIWKLKSQNKHINCVFCLRSMCAPYFWWILLRKAYLPWKEWASVR